MLFVSAGCRRGFMMISFMSGVGFVWHEEKKILRLFFFSCLKLCFGGLNMYVPFHIKHKKKKIKNELKKYGEINSLLSSMKNFL